MTTPHTRVIANLSFEGSVTCAARALIWTYPGKGSRIVVLTNQEIANDSSKYEEMWDCDVVLVPRKKYHNHDQISGSMNDVIYNAKQTFDPEHWEEKK